jgi:hypothetical protein
MPRNIERMRYTLADGVYVVVATEDDETEYWAVATPCHTALDTVRAELAPGWTLFLTGRRLTPRRVASMKMHPNSVRKLKHASN